MYIVSGGYGLTVETPQVAEFRLSGVRSDVGYTGTCMVYRLHWSVCDVGRLWSCCCGGTRVLCGERGGLSHIGTRVVSGMKRRLSVNI